MFKHKLQVISLTFSAIMLLCVGVVCAQTLVTAKVLSSEGPVEIRRQANGQPQIQPIAFKLNDELNAGDTIITGKKGRLVLGLSDGSQAVIAPQTTVVISELNQAPRTLFNLLRGKTRVHIEKLGGQPNPYRVNTPTAVIAVRGTVFDVLVADDKTEVFLHEGQVVVTNRVRPDQPIMLSAGQKTRIIQQRPPERPGDFKPGRNDSSFQGQQGNSPGQQDQRRNDGSDDRRRTAEQENRRVADNNNRTGAERGGSAADGLRPPSSISGNTRPSGSGSENNRPATSPASGGKRP